MWNMRGKTLHTNGKVTPKSPLIHGLMDIKRIDLLILTETHSPDSHSFSVPGSSVLAQTGTWPSGASMVLIAHNAFSWSCTSSVVLIPSHALLSHISHSKRTEPFWI